MKNLSDLGEFGFIEEFQKKLDEKYNPFIKGIGDDAAIIDNGDKYQVISKDLLIEGVHFDLSYYPIKHVGFKSIAVNVSDICAMNGRAKYILLGFAFSSKYTVEAIEELTNGIKSACKKYKLDIIGGDTTTISKGMVISVTCIGEVEKDKVVYRNGAKKTDLICVTGDLGSAFLGFKVLEDGKMKFRENPDYRPKLDDFKLLIAKQMMPLPRTDIIDFFQEKDILPTAMIDISDGLSSEIIHICKQSDVGCKLFKDKMPVIEEARETAKELGLDITDCVMRGGDEYELLFTLSIKDFEKIKDNREISCIGYITDSPQTYLLLDEKGEEEEFSSLGWKNF